MAYVPTDEDMESARAILDAMGLPGFYQGPDDFRPTAVVVQWVNGVNEIGGYGDVAPRGRPFESAPNAYISFEDVAAPEQGALVWLEGHDGDKHRVNGLAPEGGLWRLDLIADMDQE